MFLVEAGAPAGQQCRLRLGGEGDEPDAFESWAMLPQVSWMSLACSMLVHGAEPGPAGSGLDDLGIRAAQPPGPLNPDPPWVSTLRLSHPTRV
jgi:hypothetical protein